MIWAGLLMAVAAAVGWLLVSGQPVVYRIGPGIYAWVLGFLADPVSRTARLRMEVTGCREGFGIPSVELKVVGSRRVAKSLGSVGYGGTEDPGAPPWVPPRRKGSFYWEYSFSGVSSLVFLTGAKFEFHTNRWRLLGELVWEDLDPKAFRSPREPRRLGKYEVSLSRVWWGGIGEHIGTSDGTWHDYLPFDAVCFEITLRPADKAMPSPRTSVEADRELPRRGLCWVLDERRRPLRVIKEGGSAVYLPPPLVARYILAARCEWPQHVSLRWRPYVEEEVAEKPAVRGLRPRPVLR